MNSIRSTRQLGGRKSFTSDLPLITLAILLASSAATCFGEPAGQPEPGALLKKVAGRGHLTGTRELQQVVTWRSSGATHLAIEAAGRTPRRLWQADKPLPAAVMQLV